MMQPEVYYGEYYSVETTAGTEIIPVDVSGKVSSIRELTDYCEEQITQLEYISYGCDGYPWIEPPMVREGYLARLTMPGYLDSTAWGAYSSEEEAREALDDMYGGTDGRYYI